MQVLNIEIKAHCRDMAAVRGRLQALQPRFVGQDHQIDTYFSTDKGRLKLRQGNIENALIYYQRANSSGPKRSDVWLYPCNDNPTGLKAMLEQIHGVNVVVDKQREIYFVDNVKFHLDEVQGLGHFVEIEAIDDDGSKGEAILREQCEYYLQWLGIDPADLLEVSYSDLLRNS